MAACAAIFVGVLKTRSTEVGQAGPETTRPSPGGLRVIRAPWWPPAPLELRGCPRAEAAAAALVCYSRRGVLAQEARAPRGMMTKRSGEPDTPAMASSSGVGTTP